MPPIKVKSSNRVFLYTERRDEEIAHLEWSDFNQDAKSIRIQPKPHFGWRVKDHEVRNIDLLPGKFVRKDLSHLGTRGQIKSEINGYFLWRVQTG